MLDFPVNLRQRFLAAHGQHGMSEADENRDEGYQPRNIDAIQPPKRMARH